jgi:putative endonuclease
MSVGGRVGYDQLDMIKARDLISRAVALVQRLRTELPLGRRGERAAEKYLKRNGYRIVARNFRASGAEIDLVAIDGETLVFVEVKTRRSRLAGAPEDAVDERKQLRMRRAAEAFTVRYRVGERDLRFDIVAVDAAGKHLGIELLRNAF